MKKETSYNPQILELIEKIEGLQDLIRSKAAEGEENRRVPEDVYQALVAAGANRVCVPTQFGGFAGNNRDCLSVARAIGEADGSAAWIYGIILSGAYLAAFLPLQAQQEVWSESPDEAITVVLSTDATVTKVDGGLRVTGKWGYGTGSWHAQWTFVGINLTDDEGNPQGPALVLVPMSDLSHADDWYVAGMKATGSDTLIAEDIFVPEHRVLPLVPALEGEYPGKGVNTETSYQAVFIPALFMQLVGPHLGMGRAALDLVTEKAQSKAIAYTSYEKQADAVSFQMALAKATLLLQAAEKFAYGTADEIYEHAEAGEYSDYAKRIEYRGEAGYAVECVTQAIDMLVTAHGSAAFADRNPLQRIWRDQATAARHAHVLPATGYEVYGKVLLGRVDEARGVLGAV